MKNIFRVLILISMILFIFNSSYAMGQWLEIMSKPKVAADFSLFDLDGNKVSLDDFKGEKQLILFFWTTWCPHCRRQIKALNRLTEQLKDKDVRVLAIDTGESAKKIREFIESHPVSFTILLDNDRDVASGYRVVGVPTFVIVGLDGSIKLHENYLPEDIETSQSLF